MAGAAIEPSMPPIDTAPHRPMDLPADVVIQEDDMSASTRTIQRPMAGGSHLGAIALGVAALFAVGALAWGASNLVATRNAATTVPAQMYFDKGSRTEPNMQAAPAQAPTLDYIPQTTYSVGKVGNVTPRFGATTDPWQLGGSGYLSAAAAAARETQASSLLNQRGPGKHAE